MYFMYSTICLLFRVDFSYQAIHILGPLGFLVIPRRKLYGLLGGRKTPCNLKKHVKYVKFYLLGYNAM
jgi:hypothetical protein